MPSKSSCSASGAEGGCLPQCRPLHPLSRHLHSAGVLSSAWPAHSCRRLCDANWGHAPFGLLRALGVAGEDTEDRGTVSRGARDR
eukprot:104807-Prymnesium_polylepis.2